MTSLLLRSAAILGASALLLSACGDGDEPPAAAPSTAVEIPCKPDDVLRIANILPETGTLSFLGPPGFAGSALAIAEINDAGGVLDKPVEALNGDSGDASTTIAVTTADQMLQDEADVVVGAASSDVTKNIVDRITTAGVLQISPATTSIEFIDWADHGLFFRTAPSDQLQGAVLASVAKNDGVTKPVVLARQDSYGENLAQTFTNSFEGAGGAMAAAPVIYDPDAESFAEQVGQVAAAAPDGIVLVGYTESTKIVQELIKQGIGPDRVKLFLVDGNLSQVEYQTLAEGIMAGAKGTLPGAEADEAFRARLLQIDPELQDYSYSAETYDAVILAALAAQAAGTDCGRDIATAMVAVSSGGEKCTTFAACRDLLAAGSDIDYDGQSGPIDFAENGDVSKAVMGVYVYGADNRFTPSEFVGPVDVPALP